MFRSDYDCVNNCVCNLGKCAFYYSFDVGAEADNPTVCQSGYIGQEGTCQPGLRSKHPGNPCSSDLDCEYIDHNDKVVKTGSCTCGYNSGMFCASIPSSNKFIGSFSYCPLETGDDEFYDMTRSIKFLTQTNKLCHTLRRFGPCSELYDTDYNDYNFKL